MTNRQGVSFHRKRTPEKEKKKTVKARGTKVAKATNHRKRKKQVLPRLWVGVAREHVSRWEKSTRVCDSCTLTAPHHNKTNLKDTNLIREIWKAGRESEGLSNNAQLKSVVWGKRRAGRRKSSKKQSVRPTGGRRPYKNPERGELGRQQSKTGPPLVLSLQKKTAAIVDAEQQIKGFAKRKRVSARNGEGGGYNLLQGGERITNRGKPSYRTRPYTGLCSGSKAGMRSGLRVAVGGGRVWLPCGQKKRECAARETANSGRRHPLIERAIKLTGKANQPWV